MKRDIGTRSPGANQPKVESGAARGGDDSEAAHEVSPRGGGQALERLRPEESARVLRALLERHPDMTEAAEQLAEVLVAEVDVEAVAEDVERSVLDLGLDGLNGRAGRTRYGYTEPSEAAWELLEEALDPFFDEMRRRIELGFEAAAIGTCQGIVLGLYRCRGKNPDQVLGWAEDFPSETAAHAVATLARESWASHGSGWRLPDAFGQEVTGWVDLLRRAGQRGSTTTEPAGDR